ncbi:MAG: type II secretion system protein [Candidatus Beckwithbacteria bacterium]|nr:type II secretion system GspH family protein [Patescibacteria group bacterium]
MKKSYLFTRGFTLLELLVVISIIGILMAIGATSFSTAQKRGRDSRRMGDMKSIQKALELYYAVNNSYPDIVVSGGTIGSSPNVTMEMVPADPKGGIGFIYTYTKDSATPPNKYCVCAKTENANVANATANGSGICTYSTTSPTLFCVSNQQ